MKKLIAALAALVIVFAPSAANSNELKTDFFEPGGSQMPPKFNQVIYWADSINNGVFFNTDPFDSKLTAKTRPIVENGFKTVLSMCDVTLSVGCIRSVEYKISESWMKAQLLESPGQRDIAFGVISDQLTWDKVETRLYKENFAKGIFRASEPNLFRLNGANHRLGDTYWVNAVLNSRIENGVAKIIGLDIGAWGVKIDPNCSIENNMSLVQTTAGGYCNYLVNLPTDLEIRLSINLGSKLAELSGWFDGRIKNPEIDFGATEAGVITVSGSPIEVSAAITELIPKGDPLYSVSPEIETMQGQVGTNGISLSRGDGFQNWQKFSSKIQETAIRTNTYWRLSSWVDGSPGRYGCSNAKGVLGVVLSNAIAYTPGAPQFDRSNSSLKFEVAAPHLRADGSQNVGFYDLLVKDTVAKCLWGSGLTSNKAQISVINSDGSTQVATTTFAISNGWAKFKAYGFHYSAPRIEVKFAKPPVIKSTITCLKGKLTQKVTGTAPKCPAGYKKR